MEKIFMLSRYFLTIKGDPDEFGTIMGALQIEGFLPLKEDEQIPFDVTGVDVTKSGIVTLGKLYIETKGGLAFRFLSKNRSDEMTEYVTKLQEPVFNKYEDFEDYFKEKFKIGNACVLFTTKYQYRAGIVKGYTGDKNRIIILQVFPKGSFHKGTDEPQSHIETYSLFNIYSDDLRDDDGIKLYRAEQTRQKQGIFENFDHFGIDYIKQ